MGQCAGGAFAGLLRWSGGGARQGREGSTLFGNQALPANIGSLPKLPTQLERVLLRFRTSFVRISEKVLVFGMLIRFSFGNFRSFKEPADLIMSATELTSEEKYKNVDEDNTFVCSKSQRRLVKIAAIYGANASGKSNIIKALKFFKDFVVNSSRRGQSSDRINTEPYLLHKSTANEPSSFELEILVKGVKYRYGFEVDRKSVISEWLLFSNKSREYKIFERDRQNFTLSSNFKKEAGEVIRLTRPNALFLSVLAQFNIKRAEDIINWFSNLNFVDQIHPQTPSSVISTLLDDASLREYIVNILNGFDIGISDLILENQNPDISLNYLGFPESYTSNPDYETIKPIISKSVKTLHHIYDDSGAISGEAKFDMDANESDGTKKILLILPHLLLTTLRGGVLVVDELDSRLHSKITEMVLAMFRNVHRDVNAQLIFTTHDTNMLRRDIFRRDQVWFVEKSAQGSSSLYSLAEIQSRNDANYESDYLKGRYGALPFVNASRLKDFKINSNTVEKN